MTGRTRPDASGRVQHLIEVAGAVRTLLEGRNVPAADIGAGRDVVLTAPRPVQPRVPLLIGGNHSELLAWVGAHADAVGLSGLGRTLADGHSHTVDWSPARIGATVAAVHSGSTAAGRDLPPLEALVQVVTTTEDRRSTAAELAQETGSRVEDLLTAPYLWIGTVEEIVEQVHTARQRWGINRWVVRAGAFDTAREVIARLARNP